MVCIQSVEQGSIAQKHGILAGDILLEINGHLIGDVLDYRFYLTEPKITLKLHRGADLIDVTITKDEYEDIGLEFETFLMDEKRHCKNKCVFCFIDQLPKGLREPLYFKDDDSRLSFLLGNYVTLTNLSEAEVQRIIDMKLSPLHISVHTTNPELRVKMMKNPNAAKIMTLLKRFADANLTMDCQIVLCRDLNDGAELERTMDDLFSLYPAVESVAIVPSGLTDHREGLYPLRPFDAQTAKETIRQVERYANQCKKKCASRVFFCADELYVKAGLPVHAEAYYEGYPQLENGVGMMTSMQTEFLDALRDLDDADEIEAKEISVATGVAAYDYLCALTEKLMQKLPQIKCRVYCVENRFFGEQITVAGLLCGCDLLSQLKGKDLGQRLFLPSVMLRHEQDLFLDGMSAQELQTALGVPITFTECDGYAFVQNLLYS